jgi:hypothetical protein
MTIEKAISIMEKYNINCGDCSIRYTCGKREKDECFYIAIRTATKYLRDWNRRVNNG